jgi:hypothetical protein
VEVGLVSGKNLSVDGSFVEANAAKESRIPREQLAEAAHVHHTVRQYLREVEEQNPVEEPVHEQDQVSCLQQFPRGPLIYGLFETAIRLRSAGGWFA